MAATTKWYGKCFLAAFNKEIDYDTDTIKMMLCTSSYTPNQDTHDYKDDVTNEVEGTGYTAGGATLASKTITYDAGTNILKIDAADVVWSNSTITARYAVIYDDSPATAGTKPLICYIDFGEDIISSAGAFTVQFHADGIIKTTVS